MRNRAVSATALVLVLALAGCAGSRQLRLTGSQDIPAAQGTVKTKTTDNGNTQVDVTVEHLAPPERVNSGATVYVVWVRGSEPGSPEQSLGALKVDSKLKGSITAVTPLRSFDLYITAEPSQLGTSSTGKRLLNTTVSMK